MFYVFGAVAIVAALMCVTQRNPIASLFWLVTVMLSLAALYVLLDAQFIAAMQVLVYAGAIMVLFLFVIMLLNLGSGTTDRRGRFSWIVAAAIALGLIAGLRPLASYTPEQLAVEVSGTSDFAPDVVLQEGQRLRDDVEAKGVVGAVAEPLFETYLIPFQITGVLLMAAVAGAVVLAKRRI